MNRFVEFGILLALLLIVLLSTGGLAVWEYVHKTLRKERKEDEKNARKAGR